MSHPRPDFDSRPGGQPLSFIRPANVRGNLMKNVATIIISMSPPHGRTHSTISPVIDALSQMQGTLERIADAIEEGFAQGRRIADHFAPEPADVVGTPQVARQLGCTTVWIAEMARRGEIPKSCVVPGTGNGKPWKFYRRRVEDWLGKR